MTGLITAMGWFDGKKWGDAASTRGERPGDQEHSVTWRNVSNRAYTKFGRIGQLAKAALVATEMLGLPLVENCGKVPTGVLLATRYGTISQDHQFYRTIDRPEGSSPLLFPYTLPTGAVGEVSIRFGLTGPGLIFYESDYPLARSISECLIMIESGELDRAVCLACDAVSSEDEFLLPAQSPRPQTQVIAMLINRSDAQPQDASSIAQVSLRDNLDIEAPGDAFSSVRSWFASDAAQPLLLPTGDNVLEFNHHCRHRPARLTQTSDIQLELP